MTADTDQPTLAVNLMRRARVHAALRLIEEGTRLDDLTDDEIDTIIDAARDYRTTHEPRPAGDLREDVYGHTVIDRMRDTAENGTMEPSYRKDLFALLDLATHSPAPMAGEGWQGIATAPRDGTPFIATLVVHNLSGQKWWETHVIWADDETGEVASECEAGWSRVDDYSHWMPLPSPPAAAHPSTQES